MRTKAVIFAALGLVLMPQLGNAGEPLQRYLLAVGANSGGHDRAALKYAVSDAERFADVMVRMGGVDPVNRVVLREPGRERFESALSELEEKIARTAASGRTEVLVYYSGHADETGLRIGSDHVSYVDLRSRIERISADVRITVLDACASGAITRLKGGERRLPFLVDDSSDMKGYAFLTSSSGDEAAQESDVIGASFFTHFLVSGLRGAADVSGDGKVSLTEAYQFAFNETLARTTESMGGAQHPAYHMNLAGTGDVVMTDVRRTSAGLVLDKDLEGRFYVRDQNEHLVAELFKPQGRRMVLGLEAGTYQIHMERVAELFVARVDLGLEDLLVLLPDHFETAERTPAVARGGSGSWPPRPGFMGPLVGRSRIELTIGMNQAASRAGDDAVASGLVSSQSGTNGLFYGLGYSRWIRETLSLGLTLVYLEGNYESSVGTTVEYYTAALISLRVGARKYLPASLLKTPVRPFLSFEVGVLVGSESQSAVGGPGVSATSSTMGAFGSVLGLGVDVLLSRHFMLGVKGSYFFVTDFPEPLAGTKNYSGPEFSVSLSWLVGRGFEG